MQSDRVVTAVRLAIKQKTHTYLAQLADYLAQSNPVVTAVGFADKKNTPIIPGLVGRMPYAERPRGHTHLVQYTLYCCALIYDVPCEEVDLNLCFVPGIR